MLGRFLEKKGYTSHAPIYRGHGVSPEELIETTPDDWWEDVEEAYQFLQYLGYKEIAVAGLSMGGVLGLKLANQESIKAVITMCTPMFFDNKTQLTKGFKSFATQYKQLEGKEDEVIESEVTTLMENSTAMFSKMGPFIEEVRQKVELIKTPAFVVQAKKDEMINPESANVIYEHLATDDKTIKWYEESGHVITLDKEKEQLHKDIYTFLESLNWEQ